MWNSTLKRHKPLQSDKGLKRSRMRRKSKGKQARAREFSPEIIAIVKERSNGVCEWCGQERIANYHHCRFRSGLGGEGSGGLENALGIGVNCDALVHSGTEGSKYRVLFAHRARELAKGVETR